MSARKAISAILGVIFLVLGVIPLLNQYGVIGFALPTVGGMILWVLAVIGGLFLLFDGFQEEQEMRKALAVPSFIIALVLLAVGLVPLLSSFGVIGFALPGFIYSIFDFLFAAAGLFLLIGATQGII